MAQEIERIYWEDDSVVRVGFEGITKITEREEILGEYGIVWLEAWAGTKLRGKHNAKYVGGVQYKHD